MATIGRVESVDIIIRDNATFKMDLTYQDPETGLPIDLTGWDIDMQFRDKKGGTVKETFAVGTGFTMDVGNGLARLKIQPAQVQAWTFDKGVYDIRVTDTIGDKDVWLEGAFTVVRGVTYS